MGAQDADAIINPQTTRPCGHFSEAMTEAAAPTSCGFSKQMEEKFRKLNAWFAESATVQNLAGKCGLQPWVIGAAGTLWLAGFIMWALTGEVICTAIGSLYPLYASFRAVEDNSHREIKHWLVYWITYAAVMLLEGFVQRLLSWVPFYRFLRLAFVLWLFLPLTRGSKNAYKWAVRPVLRRYRPGIDQALARSQDELEGTLSGERNVEMFRAVRSAATAVVRATTPTRRRPQQPAAPSKDLGIDDLVAKELAREAAQRIYNAASVGVSIAGSAVRSSPPRANARKRVDSPAPKALAAKETALDQDVNNFIEIAGSPIESEDSASIADEAIAKALVDEPPCSLEVACSRSPLSIPAERKGRELASPASMH